MNDYFESAAGYTLTHDEIWKVFQDHCQTLADFLTFLAETGQKETYAAQEVLVWLGY